jgi:ABC-type Na+ efflux pump permease subunit
MAIQSPPIYAGAAKGTSAALLGSLPFVPLNAPLRGPENLGFLTTVYIPFLTNDP